MIYELCVYQPVSGQMPKLLARFRDHTVHIWKKHFIRPLGFWTTLIRESSNELTYMLPSESLAIREMKWNAFLNDPDWRKVRDDSERGETIVASTALLWVLRDVLSMTGTKFGCGMALCGACTVHVDGAPTRSCITPVDSLSASEVTTIEAIGSTAAGAKIQKAWLELEVVQCGYCQSGQIMSASALLATNPHPTDSCNLYSVTKGQSPSATFST
jgi:isoquinoline 1-oxidoreductase alpha subunit